MKKLFITLCIANLFLCNAQDHALISNYQVFSDLFNPSFQGTDKFINISFFTRKQWVGFEDAPSTQVFMMNSFIDKIKSGIGLSVYNDNIGKENSLMMMLNYSYKIHLGQYLNITSGLAGGPMNKKINVKDLVYEEIEPVNNLQSFSSFMPAISIGIKINYINYTIGFSLLNTFDNPNDDIKIEYPTFYTGYFESLFELNDNLSVQPFFCYYNSLKSNMIMFGNTFFYKKKYWAGLSYRHMESVIGMFGCMIGKKLSIEYLYDFAVGNIQYYHNGSHEIFLKFSLPKKEKEYFYHKSPRFF